MEIDPALDSSYNCHTNNLYYTHVGRTGQPFTAIGILGAQRTPPRLLFPEEVKIPNDDAGPETARQGG